MIEPSNPILSKMLDRLFASMVSGPAMNCRPHASRQRIDLVQFGRLKDVDAGAVLLSLVGSERCTKLAARVPAPAKATASRAKPVEDHEADELTPDERAARQAWSDQQSLLTKLRVIADDARTYEQDTGVHALNIGFPLLSLPPGTFGGRGGVASRRILAPIAFIPVMLTVKSGAKQTIELTCRGEGVDLVIPNIALLAWLEQQTGQPVENPFEDGEGANPWREIGELVRLVAQRVDIAVPEMLAQTGAAAQLELRATPKADQDETGPSIVPAAVLGLFPTANQGLLNDTREMVANGAPDGPLESFVRHGVSLDAPAIQQAELVDQAAPAPAEASGFTRVFTDERLITHADPCQTRAVRLARQARGLVVHGPPGTGKSQTIANVIGDHLARGERVLFVCDKRTAIDVVADRLRSLGLGDLFATVHDPQRDQREFYRSVREQLDNLADTPLKAHGAERLAKIDRELQGLHDELTRYYRELMGKHGGPGSFHHLVGQWLSETGDAGNAADWTSLQALDAAEFELHKGRLKEVLERGETVGYATNPWKPACGVDLRTFLSKPMDAYRESLEHVRGVAQATDATADALHPPFDAEGDITAEAERRSRVAEELNALQELPEASARHWARQSLSAVDAAQRALTAAAEWTAEVKAHPLDRSLLNSRRDLPAPEQLAAEQKTLHDYAAAFEAHATKYAHLRAAAPDASDATLQHWMKADAKTAAAARKRLSGAAGIAQAVDASTLDASLLARFEAAPIEPTKIIESLAALSAYLEVAGKWYAIFQPSKKKAADPVVRRFGLSLSAASAGQVRQFLADLQNRSDLQSAVEAAVGQPFDARPDDAELVATYKQHHAVLEALGTGSLGERQSAPTASDGATTAAVNALLGAQAEAARALLQAYGLSADAAGAHRLADLLKGVEARLRIAQLLKNFGGLPDLSLDTADEELLKLIDLHERLFVLLARDPSDTPVGAAIAKALGERAIAANVIEALRASPQRAAAVLALEQATEASALFSKPYLKAVRTTARSGKHLLKAVTSLVDRLDTLDGVIRVNDGLTHLPKTLSVAAGGLLASDCNAATGFSAIRRNVLAGEIVRRLQSCPDLQTIDGHRLKIAFDRFRELSASKKEVVRDVAHHLWVARQKERLLASTGTRLNSTGADLRRRLTTRGERAMRLRQVISHGASVEGGDPLFDLRPIWMASPETVAQLFPRAPIFDVVVFDEASQCRLEEALPVLTRAHRVVIAGDPRQLPPTRFFESAVITSEEVDGDTEQELFESHQGEVEDLLTAALGLDVHQCYLDVHYRSRNADLIGFSNEHFYGSRLQAIPGHPRNRTRYAPITLYRADGVYEKRQNLIEAQRVCKIVRDLLKRASPPSIGIACFNLVQRDLIVETLEELAETDDEFAARLAEARHRRSASGSEGLFVKNLENVQGDERDHIIISTTYGPDPAGKFRRSFGPLGTAGGGRRFNVLVTRARNELHIVTSIPKGMYAALPEVPSGTTPSGAWLLFAYLAYAEQLQKDYELNHRILESSGPVERASVNAHPSRTPSQFAKALASRIAAAHNHGSDVHWGNEGFCVDVAMQHPSRAEDVTIGVQCDMTRFAGSEDPVEWDVFSTAVHESQGWRLHRIWTPHFFRDTAGSMKEIGASVEATLKAERDAAPASVEE